MSQPTSLAPSAALAMSHLRDPHQFSWNLVPLLAIVVYIYCVEAGRGRWNLVLTGLGCSAVEWFGEIANSMILHCTGYAPLWSEPGPSSYLILVGINVETLFMFLLYGLAVAHVLPTNRRLKWLGISNRLWVTGGFAGFCVVVEVALNRAGALAWEYRWWNWPQLWTVFLFAYCPAAWTAVWIHDLKSDRVRAKVLAVALAVDIVVTGVLIHLQLI